MKKLIFVLLLCSTVSHAEWYRVQFVESYNTIKAAKADGNAEPIVIRVRNLEKIEFIQPDPDKVLLGGLEAENLTRAILQGQLVWVDNMRTEEGANVADVYPAFEQVVMAYRDHRIVNGDNITESTKGKLRIIYNQMLDDLDLSPLTLSSTSDAQAIAEESRAKLHKLYMGMIADIRNNTIILKSNSALDDENFQEVAYENEFYRTIFTARAILWFRNNGQFMHPTAQKLYVDLLQSFQTDVSQDARFTQVRIEAIQLEQELFKELFIDEKDYERGKFTYTCLDWFKNRGQYTPENVQNVFINWLRSYQQATGTESDFMQERLQWMIDNNDLYFDFIELGI